MIGQLENLLKTTPGDGARTPLGAGRPEFELDALLDAWFRERHDSVECQLCLDETWQLLLELVDQDRMTPSLRRRAKKLIRTIRSLQDVGLQTRADEE
jgi:hypothetical protein